MMERRRHNAEAHLQDFPHLGGALDPVRVREGLEAFLRSEYPRQGVRLSEARVDRVSVSPGRGCRILYRVAGQDAGGAFFEQWLLGRMEARDGEHQRGRSDTEESGNHG